MMMEVRSRVKLVQFAGYDVLVIDYSDCKEDEMIAVLMLARDEVAKYSKPLRIVSVFNDKCYATPNFMLVAKREVSSLGHLIKDQALVGLSPVKKMILKGFNAFQGRSFKDFKTLEEAMAYLTKAR